MITIEPLTLSEIEAVTLSSSATLALNPVKTALNVYALESLNVITHDLAVGAAEAVDSHSASKAAPLVELGSYITSTDISPESIVPPRNVRNTSAIPVVSIVATDTLGEDMLNTSPIATELYENVVPFAVIAMVFTPLLVPYYKI